ncbi:MAG: hypothetical protein KDD44_06420, partial [Bdellovibrionales bacterium]|nr:hypothetical protein [Bdellovibrionales bacterium]
QQHRLEARRLREQAEDLPLNTPARDELLAQAREQDEVADARWTEGAQKKREAERLYNQEMARLREEQGDYRGKKREAREQQRNAQRRGNEMFDQALAEMLENRGGLAEAVMLINALRTAGYNREAGKLASMLSAALDAAGPPTDQELAAAAESAATSIEESGARMAADLRQRGDRWSAQRRGNVRRMLQMTEAIVNVLRVHQGRDPVQEQWGAWP